MKHVSGYTNSARFRALEDLQKDSADLCLIYCGWEYCEPGHRYGPNMRTTYVLHIIRSGRGTLEIHNQKYELTAGDAFLLCPDVEAWYEADWEDPWFRIFYIIVFPFTAPFRLSGFLCHPFHLVQYHLCSIDQIIDL